MEKRRMSRMSRGVDPNLIKPLQKIEEAEEAIQDTIMDSSSSGDSMSESVDLSRSSFVSLTSDNPYAKFNLP